MNLDAIRARLDSRREYLRNLRVAVLCGGVSAEREVSLNSGRAVVSHLADTGYNPELLCIDETGLGILPPAGGEQNNQDSTALKAAGVDAMPPAISTLRGFSEAGVVFTVMHGTWGEDGVFQGLFELLGLPYVSADVHGSALAMDKLATKRIARALGLLTPDYWVVRPEDAEPVAFPADITELVIKPVQQGSSVGIEMTDNDARTWERARRAAEKYGTVLVERRIFGRELTVGMLGHTSEPVALPVVEIQPRQGFYDYTAKYTAGASDYICPAQIPSETAARVQQSATVLYRELGLSPYARIDFILDDDGRGWLLEANTLPGFTGLSLLPMAARAAGVEFAELVEILILLAVERHERRGGI